MAERNSSGQRCTLRLEAPGLLFRTLALSLGIAFMVAVPPLGAQEYLIGPDSIWLVTKGTRAQPPSWKDIDFKTTAAWFEGLAPIGYGEPGIRTELDDMRQQGGNPGYVSIFLRAEFAVQDPFPIQKMVLHVVYDDGFVAYLNGVPIAYRNMPSGNNPPYNLTASSAIEKSDPQANLDLNITARKNLLVPGKNVLAVQVHNASLTSSDLWWEATLEVEFIPNPFVCVENVACEDLGDGAVSFTWTLPGSGVDQIVVREEGNDEPVLTVEGSQPGGILRGVTEGEHLYRVFAQKGGQECYGGICIVSVSPIQFFIRGDVNDDGKLNLVDPIFLAHYLFQGGEEPTCADTGDQDDNGELNVSDVVYLLRYLFDGGPEPAPPGPTTCGPDQELDSLPKCQYQSCPGEEQQQ